MGQYAAFNDQGSLEEQVKNLADEELLDFWEETQQLARMLDQEEQMDIEYNPEYERVILQELQYRTCFKGQF
jgi:division protein CdvB (Snf7/Vps24/ESCRT-III family)